MTNMFTKTAIAALLAGSLGTAATAGTLGAEAKTDVEAGVQAGSSGALDTAQGAADQARDAVTSTAQAVQDGASDLADATEGGASADASLNYGTVISGLNNGSTAGAAAEIEALDSEVTVDTVLLSEIDGAEQAQALDTALNAQADAIASFHEAIEANSHLTAALDAQGFTADDVVGFEAEGEGNVTLVIDDRA
ncbi:hypothetical protein [Vannielia litorea]|uniref:Uncharacterized protein n=1 Tax=Vannielia litorea TaxID=1217970 RepID=A0A1N6ID14_9RHOB|nr:hypothetical protein [Vannielia litorea]SIO29903.1 hypothetical protein SAMN05444002_3719 [Vannielia litorea]